MRSGAGYAGSRARHGRRKTHGMRSGAGRAESGTRHGWRRTHGMSAAAAVHAAAAAAHTVHACGGLNGKGKHAGGSTDQQ